MVLWYDPRLEKIDPGIEFVARVRFVYIILDGSV
jgi:hypothetical protein